MKTMINTVLGIRGYKIEKIKKNKKVDQNSVTENNGSSIKTNRLAYYKTNTGNYFIPKDAKKDIIANSIINNQVFEEEVVELAKTYIEPGTVVLDIGSNFGQMAILFANFVGEEGVVYAFEADDFIYEILCKNIKANNKEKVILPHFGAVHDKPNETLIFPVQDFKRFNTYGAYGINYNAQDGRKVKTVSVDSLNIQKKISLMKIDIQGGDLFGMQGAINTIKNHKMPILFEYEYHFEKEFNYTFQDYVDFVQSINYKFDTVINGHNFLILPK